MFTGIVEELGTVEALEDQGDAVRLTVRGPLVTSDAARGDSISVNGCCLTVTATTDGQAELFTADVMHETLAKTSLGALEPGAKVNLERAVTPATRLGGHIVQGHVDGTGTVVRRTPSEHWELVEISLPADLERYLVPKGSITVDGISPDGRRRECRVVHRQPDPRDPRPHHAGLQAGRRPRQPRGRRDREVRREDGEAMTEHTTERASEHREFVSTTWRRRSPTSPPARRSWSSTTRTARTRATSSSPRRRATPELMAFTIRHSSGVICVPMPADMLDRLEIPLMTPHNKDKLRTAYTISVDARDGVSTGISAADRAHTARVLADSATEAWEVTRPGHVFPLRYREGGVLVRRGHTEAAVDLARMAGLTPAGVLVEVVNDDGTMKRGDELRAFADEHGLKMISIDQMVHYRRRTESHVERLAETVLPTSHGDFTAFGYRITVDGSEHVALVYGDPTALSDGEPVLTRVHSECLTGDVLGSERCDCGPQLNEAMDLIVKEGRGVVIYLRGHEGRGIGLLAKLQAYQLQDGGRDTVDANLDLGLPADARHYGAATQILRDLGVTSVRLLTNNPAKTSSLESYGIPVAERVGLTPRPNDHNLAYLQTKRDRMGHHLGSLEQDHEGGEQ